MSGTHAKRPEEVWPARRAPSGAFNGTHEIAAPCGILPFHLTLREWTGYTYVYGKAIYVLEKPKEKEKPRKENLVVSNDRPAARR